MTEYLNTKDSTAKFHVNTNSLKQYTQQIKPKYSIKNYFHMVKTMLKDMVYLRHYNSLHIVV